VLVQGVRVGRVSDVLLYESGGVIGVEVRSEDHASVGFLPEPRLARHPDGDGVIAKGPYPLLTKIDAAFYLRRGARWLARDPRRPEA
jgi:hypothetical protein